MPKQLYKITGFHGGLNSNSDARDIADNELSEATDVMVDELGKIRMMGGTSTSSMPTANAAIINAGYGLFQFSHDRLGGNFTSTNLSGTHTGGDSDTVLIDAAAAFTTSLVGATVNNTTDGSSGTVVSVDSATRLTLDDLTGGSDNSWDDAANDAYTITGFAETGDDYLAIVDADDAANIDIYSRVDSTWGTEIIDLGAVTGMESVFYIVDGALRVCDSDFGNSNTSKWYGYVDRQHFENALSGGTALTPGGSADTYDKWHVANAAIAPPTRGITGTLSATADGSGGAIGSIRDASAFDTDWDTELDAGVYLALNATQHEVVAISAMTDASNLATADLSGGTDWNGDAWSIWPPAGTGFNLRFDNPSTTSGTLLSGTYELASTFIYDAEPGDLNAQESPLYVYPSTLVTDNNEGFGTVHFFLTSPYDARITGGRVYSRKTDTGDPWMMITEMSFKYGIRRESEDVYRQGWSHWDSDNNNTTILVRASHSVTSLGTRSYDVNTGMDQDDTTSTAKYKTAVIANRVAYIGNVQIDGVIHGDSILQSPANRFDMFSKNNELAASISDGDSIIKLEEYADRILQFKKRKMQLINISQYGSEFLEDTFMHKGVSHPAAVCKTDFGIAWVNEQGCYIYDGKNVTNLLEKGGRQIIKESEWEDFAVSPMIGYIPKKRQLIVADDVGVAGDGRAYLYDMVTQSWVEGGNSTFPDADSGDVKTNFVIDWNNDLTFAYNDDVGTVVKWDDAADTSTAVDIKTKDIDFGQPGQLKNIYKVYLTYRGNATHVQVHYGINGLAPALTFNSITSGTDGSSTGSGTAAKCIAYNAGVTDWLKAELKPSAAISNINSFRLKISGDGSNAIAADFEINDISIVYRLKGQR